MKIELGRRSFLGVAAAAVGGLSAQKVSAQEAPKPEEPPKPEPSKADSGPVLQIPSPTSIGVAWAVTGLATGYVEIAENEKLEGARRVNCISPEIAVNALDERILSARIEGLKPATKYWYRINTVPITAPHAYKTDIAGPTEVGKINSFTTPGEKADSSFSVINDTHDSQPAFDAIVPKLKELGAAVTVWNGDIWNHCEEREYAVRILLKAYGNEYAASTPLLYVPGNHDYRGKWCRNLPNVFLMRSPEERAAKFWRLGRNFAVRQGDIAMIGLDTGEDKPDANPLWCELAAYEPYRKLQAQWLEKALAKPEIDGAPYIVVFCHIPLFDPRPNANPGDILPADRSRKSLESCYAAWTRQCAELWGPLFAKHRVQLVVAAHQHAFRYDKPAANRPWAQIVGGGPLMKEGRTVTVIHGSVREGTLRVAVHDMVTKSVIGEFSFTPRA